MFYKSLSLEITNYADSIYEGITVLGQSKS